jgi:hydrogenase/urease accessory protein HupE
MAKYWFARRFPVSEVNANRMGPISREGWLVAWSFVGCMVLGAIGLVTCTFVFRQPLLGFAILLVLSSTGMTAFLTLAYQRGDKQHTVDDYKQGRVQNT